MSFLEKKKFKFYIYSINFPKSIKIIQKKFYSVKSGICGKKNKKKWGNIYLEIGNYVQDISQSLKKMENFPRDQREREKGKYKI